ncbi:unnamed protein product [Amoebophrya sp. A25]|nr:unnamed protein product [Amoebophrya sp. A25]|eukprot:GSA25T00026278001.1
MDPSSGGATTNFHHQRDRQRWLMEARKSPFQPIFLRHQMRTSVHELGATPKAPASGISGVTNATGQFESSLQQSESSSKRQKMDLRDTFDRAATWMGPASSQLQRAASSRLLRVAGAPQHDSSATGGLIGKELFPHAVPVTPRENTNDKGTLASGRATFTAGSSKSSPFLGGSATRSNTTNGFSVTSFSLFKFLKSAVMGEEKRQSPERKRKSLSISPHRKSPVRKRTSHEATCYMTPPPKTQQSEERMVKSTSQSVPFSYVTETPPVVPRFLYDAQSGTIVEDYSSVGPYPDAAEHGGRASHLNSKNLAASTAATHHANLTANTLVSTSSTALSEKRMETADSPVALVPNGAARGRSNPYLTRSLHSGNGGSMQQQAPGSSTSINSADGNSREQSAPFNWTPDSKSSSNASNTSSTKASSNNISSIASNNANVVSDANKNLLRTPDQNRGFLNSATGTVSTLKAKIGKSPQQTASLRKAQALANEVRLDTIAEEAVKNISGQFGRARPSQKRRSKRQPLADKTNTEQADGLLGGGKKALTTGKDYNQGPLSLTGSSATSIAIILDWDDTLFPTTMLKMLVPQQYVSTPDGVRRTPRNAEFDAYCRYTLGPMVEQLLEKLIAFGSSVHLSIITNAMPDWIQACCERYYPKAVRDLLAGDKIDVLSAREKFFTLKSQNGSGNGGMDAADPLKWKVFTFAGWLGQGLRNNSIDSNYHLIVAGDSPTDISAGHAMKSLPSCAPSYVTSIHFVPRPSTRMLATELIRFAADFGIYLSLKCGLGFGFHLLHEDCALQNRRVADQQRLFAPDVAKLPLLTDDFGRVFEEQQGVAPDEADALVTTAELGQRVMGRFAEVEPIPKFQNDDTMRHAEGGKPHAFLYLVQTEEAAYAECIETIILSRQHLQRQLNAKANA